MMVRRELDDLEYRPGLYSFEDKSSLRWCGFTFRSTSFFNSMVRGVTMMLPDDAEPYIFNSYPVNSIVQFCIWSLRRVDDLEKSKAVVVGDVSIDDVFNYNFRR